MGREIFGHLPLSPLTSPAIPTRRSPEVQCHEKDRLKEKCAVFGVYTSQNAAPLVYLGLSALQHRGQEASGISASDGSLITHKGEGLVSQVYRRGDIDRLSGKVAIGHNRYATNGGQEHIQPVTSERNLIALAHNGTLPQAQKLEAFLQSNGVETSRLNDSEMMQRAIEHYMGIGLPVEESIRQAYPLFTGAFALVVMTKDKLVGLRDSHGVRPLSIGGMGGGEYALSSETYGLDRIKAKHLRDVRPGEMVVVDKEGLHSYQLEEGKEQLDIFELIYFSRTESRYFGKQVNEMRRALGKKLAEETKPLWEHTDIVFGVPNSSVPAAAGFAAASGVWYEADALIKDAYAHRTFIKPDQTSRIDSVRAKFIPVQGVLKGKRIVVVDDSIVRGNTLKELVQMLREAEVAEVNVVISSPPVKYPDFYGVDTPRQQELIASRMSIEEMRQFIGADKLHFLSYQGMIDALGIPEENLCTSCFTGEYPIDIGENRRRINFSV